MSARHSTGFLVYQSPQWRAETSGIHQFVLISTAGDTRRGARARHRQMQPLNIPIRLAVLPPSPLAEYVARNARHVRPTTIQADPEPVRAAEHIRTMPSVLPNPTRERHTK